MTRGAKSLIFLLVLLALLGGCKKKKPSVPPAKAQAPTLNVPPAPSEPQPHPDRVRSLADIPLVEPLPPKPNKPNKKTPYRKPEPKQDLAKSEVGPDKKPAKSSNPTIDSSPQLVASMPAGEAMQQRQGTSQLRATTEKSLLGLTRSLSTDEVAMVQQIRTYLQQSCTAETDGDTERAYNLAFKAHLLCDELVKR